MINSQTKSTSHYSLIPPLVEAKSTGHCLLNARWGVPLCALVVCLFALAFAGCSSKKSGDGDGAAGISDEDLALQNQNRFGDGNIPLAQSGGMFEDVHFDFDSAAISGINRDILEKNAAVLKSNPSMNLTLEGHCDRRGTNEYNLALGEARARSVAAMLVNLGISANRLSTISYGEEIPVDPADNESAYAQNRRVHFAAQAGTTTN